jgi:hypothetical protein
VRATNESFLGSATLGRLKDLRQSGQLERLLRSGARFADKAIVVARYGSDRWEETKLR